MTQGPAAQFEIISRQGHRKHWVMLNRMGRWYVSSPAWSHISWPEICFGRRVLALWKPYNEPLVAIFPSWNLVGAFPYALSCILTCEAATIIPSSGSIYQFHLFKGELDPQIAIHSLQRGKLHLRFIHPDEKAEFKKKPTAQSPQLDAKLRMG